jgi:hypothetical protein
MRAGVLDAAASMLDALKTPTRMIVALAGDVRISRNSPRTEALMHRSGA